MMVGWRGQLMMTGRSRGAANFERFPANSAVRLIWPHGSGHTFWAEWIANHRASTAGFLYEALFPGGAALLHFCDGFEDLFRGG